MTVIKGKKTENTALSLSSVCLSIFFDCLTDILKRPKLKTDHFRWSVSWHLTGQKASFDAIRSS